MFSKEWGGGRGPRKWPFYGAVQRLESLSMKFSERTNTAIPQKQKSRNRKAFVAGEIRRQRHSVHATCTEPALSLRLPAWAAARLLPLLDLTSASLLMSPPKSDIE